MPFGESIGAMNTGMPSALSRVSPSRAFVMSEYEPIWTHQRSPCAAAAGAAATGAVGASVGLGVAVGACSALKRSYRDCLVKEAGEPILFVYLEGSRKLIEERASARHHEFMPSSLVGSQFDTLEVPGPDENAISEPVTLPVETIAERVVKAVPHLKSFRRKQ